MKVVSGENNFAVIAKEKIDFNLVNFAVELGEDTFKIKELQDGDNLKWYTKLDKNIACEINSTVKLFGDRVVLKHFFITAYLQNLIKRKWWQFWKPKNSKILIHRELKAGYKLPEFILKYFKNTGINSILQHCQHYTPACS